MSLPSDCQSSVAICFTGQIDNEKRLLQSNWPQKKSLAKAMLNKNVYIVYQPKEKNIVKDMELTS